MGTVHLSKGCKVHISCIERYKLSENFGRKVINYVNLWDKVSRNGKPIARLTCGEEVEILDWKDKQHEMYYKVRAVVTGTSDHIDGWMKFNMIDEAIEGSYG